MQTIRKMLIVLLCVVMAFALTACNREPEPEPTEAPEATEAVSTEEPADEATPTPAPTEAPTPAPTEAPKEVVGLEDWEEEVLENDLVSEDLVVITDEDYVEKVRQLIDDTGENRGWIFQLEGVYVLEGDHAYVSRTLVNGDETEQLRLPLVNQNKAIADGAWVRVMGVLEESELDGETVNVLNVVTIEALAERGSEELAWDGAEK